MSADQSQAAVAPFSQREVVRELQERALLVGIARTISSAPKIGRGCSNASRQSRPSSWSSGGQFHCGLAYRTDDDCLSKWSMGGRRRAYGDGQGMGEAAAVPVRASWVSTSRFSQTTIETASELTGRVAPDVPFRVQFATPSWARVAIKAVKPSPSSALRSSST